MTTPAAATSTHQGGHPDHNEDRAWLGRRVWAVADGMGGHQGGEVASSTALEAFQRIVEGAEESTDLDAVLRAAVAAAGAALRAKAEAEPELRAMGTTLVAAGLDADGSLVVAHLGDSRAYLLGPDGMTPLTRDDNVAEQMLALGMIDAQQAATHPGQYQLTKALTAYDPSTPEPTLARVGARGRLLLCSDGLTGELSDETVAGLLGQGDPHQAAQALVDAAVRAPARDNVTVVVVDLPDGARR